VAELKPFAGQQHLDVAGGTGDVAFRVLRAIRAAERSAGVTSTSASASAGASPQDQQQQRQQHAHAQPQARGHVTVCDINASMLDVGRQKAASQGLSGA
jgi:2-methoxy-6-polyprenyl-1,4-benzoquinol methylase